VHLGGLSTPDESQSVSSESLVRTAQRDLTSKSAIAATPYAAIDARIADPSTPLADAIALTQIRHELTRQDEFRSERKHLRDVENRNFWGKIVFSAGAVAVGLGLIAVGHPEGFVIVGTGVYWLAPDFVRSMYERMIPGGNGGEKSDAE
jgi:hypothetical protein